MMLALRVTSRPARAFSASLVRQRRCVSGDSHHHEDSHDVTTYPKEGFNGPFWRNTVLLTLGLVGIVTFLPSDDLSGAASKDVEEAPWLTRVIAHNSPSRNDWAKANETHLEQAEILAENTRLVQSAKPPPVLRYKYPLKFEQVSPHRIPVGGGVDLSDLEVK